MFFYINRMKGLLYNKGKLDNIFYFQILRDENHEKIII